MISTKTGFIILAALGTGKLAAAYDDLLFTEDFFPLINTRLDPIVSPGAVSSHVHHVAGSSAFGASTDFAALQASECTTANLAQDKSNYWVPLLHYKWKNGSYSAITGDGLSAYWKMPLTNPTDGAGNFAVVPDDFRVVAGSVNRVTYNSSNALDNAVSFQCIDAKGSYDKTPYIPTDRECLTIRPQINFPECWDGVNAYKQDGSHVSYPIDGNPEGGKCPAGYHKIPHLFLESTYHIKAENIGEGYEWYPGCFVLATGDSHGYSFHADWLNGFPSGFIVDTFKQCYDGNTISKTCAPIDQGRNEAYNNGKDSNNCKSAGEIVNESAGQQMAIASLPGNNPLYDSSVGASSRSSNSYTEKAKVVQISETTQGYCLGGKCTDYAGSDIVVSTGGDSGSSVSSVAGSNVTSSSNGTEVTSVTAQNETATSSVISATAAAAATSGLSTSNLLSGSNVTSPSNETDVTSALVGTATTSSIDVAPATATAASDDGDDGAELVCERRKKKRVFQW
ncbi:hypothetical protein CI109_106625 [Kwoniella shandongensis]|uniref:DUF1996 domain-containing protein n=1 Tax=Kwoniella shandongensis TaxID=1734106 RepID=A0A5M6BR01_9TREE|nr:uncharacterized protein CI109_007167 [Kwoniella shandongensis]KAA5524512.1 hypothetical protein CI109_007167 [Kwoniella shandongensis]